MTGRALYSLSVTFALLLSGCSLILGESSSAVNLRNPTTGQMLICGRGMHRGSPTREELKQRDKCVADAMSKGFRIGTGDNHATFVSQQ